jgi:hypothetical protein
MQLYRVASFDRSWLLRAGFVSVVLIAWVIAYQPVLFNFHTSDDFYFITRLHAAKQNPMLLFHGMDDGTPYYRPLLYVLLFCEYLLSGANGCLLRGISLFYELFTVEVLAIGACLPVVCFFYIRYTQSRLTGSFVLTIC